MACNTCGQSSCECKLGAYACPKLSNPPKCDELKDLKSEMMDELEANREYVSACSPESTIKYIDSIVERLSCLNDQELNALCYLLNKPELVFDDTASVDMTKTNNHVKSDVKLSKDDGNILQIKKDGVYASVQVQEDDIVPFDIKCVFSNTTIQGRGGVGLSQGGNGVIPVPQAQLEELLKDQELVIANIVDHRFAPTDTVTFVGFFTFGSVDGINPIDLAIPFSGEVRENGEITIKELSPMVPSYVYTFKRSDGTTGLYPSGSSSIIRYSKSTDTISCIARADASISNVSWSNSYKGEN